MTDKTPADGLQEALQTLQAEIESMENIVARNLEGNNKNTRKKLRQWKCLYEAARHAAPAGDCKHPRVDHNGECLDCDEFPAPAESGPCAYWARFGDGSGKIFENKEEAENYAGSAYTDDIEVVPVYREARAQGAAVDVEKLLEFLPERKPDTRAELPDKNFQDSDAGREEAAYVRAKNHGWNLAIAIIRKRIRERLPAPSSEKGEIDHTKCSRCGGPADNGHDRCIPPNPYLCMKCKEQLMYSVGRKHLAEQKGGSE